jgi:TRAP-type uncharacterized transport system fused permease subunit
VHPKTRPRLKRLIQCFVGGAIMAATFGIACGCIGILVKSMTFTGAATKLSLLITTLSGGHTFPTLIMTMLLSIVLASSLPTVIAYIVVAFVASPILVDLGVPLEIAHFFVFYYAILATVTPPIAGGAIVGSQIAGCSYAPASIESFKLAAPFFLLPFFMVNNPIVLSESQPAIPAVMAMAALVLAMGAMTCTCQGYCLARMTRLERILFFVSALSATWYGLKGESIFFAASLLLVGVSMVIQWKRRKRVRGEGNWNDT